MKSGNKAAIRSELENQLRVAETFKASGYDKEAKQACANRTAALVAETAMAWHLEAIGSQDSAGRTTRPPCSSAAALYQRVVDSWTKQELASFQFPRLVKEDWPTLFKVKYAMADLLYSQKDWAKCGPASTPSVAEDPTGPEAAKSSYASGLCYQNLYEASHQGDAGRRSAGNFPGRNRTEATESVAARLEPKPIKGDQLAMVKAFDRYICTIKPAANDAAGLEQLIEVKYARARTYFEAQHWRTAAAAFREIAMSYPDSSGGIYAAQLYLESANVLYQHSRRPPARTRWAPTCRSSWRRTAAAIARPRTPTAA